MPPALDDKEYAKNSDDEVDRVRQEAVDRCHDQTQKVEENGHGSEGRGGEVDDEKCADGDRKCRAKKINNSHRNIAKSGDQSIRDVGDCCEQSPANTPKAIDDSLAMDLEIAKDESGSCWLLNDCG